MNRRQFAVLGASALGACAPFTQSPQIAPAGFSGPQLQDDALIASDGVRLPLTIWPAADGQTPWAVVVGLHGMDDYAQAFTVAGPYWAAAGVTTYAYDQRGFGRGPDRGLWGGSALMDDDIRTACALVRRRHPGAVLAVAGESMGGAAAISAFASPTAPDADRLILLSPAVWGWSEQPLPSRLALWIAAHCDPGGLLEPPRWLYRRYQATDNIPILRQMGRDRNMIFKTRIDATYGLMNLMQDASDHIGRVRVPTLYAYGAHDAFIPKRAAYHAAAQLPALGRTAFYKDGWHLLNRDLHADAVLGDVVSFLKDPAAPFPSGAPPIPPPGSRTPKDE